MTLHSKVEDPYFHDMYSNLYVLVNDSSWLDRVQYLNFSVSLVLVSNDVLTPDFLHPSNAVLYEVAVIAAVLHHYTCKR